MDYHWSNSGSGLVLPHLEGDEATIGKQLKQYDPCLRLVPQGMKDGKKVYKVFWTNGSVTNVLFTWATPEGDPLPLSSAILEKCKMLDKNTRAEKKDPDALNARLRAEGQKDMEDAAQDLYDDLRRREGRLPLLPRKKKYDARRNQDRTQ